MSVIDPLAARAPEDMTAQALRAVYLRADKATRQKLNPILPPAVITFGDVRLAVDPRDNYTERRIWLDGHPPERASLAALIDLIAGKRALVLDIGANCGAFAIPLARAAGPGSRVIAFEPNPVMIGRLGHNVALNGLGQTLRIEGCALGETAGEATLNFHGRNFGQASLRAVPNRKRRGGTLVPVRRLDEFTADADGYEIGVIKIDVEGGEGAALAPLLDAEGWVPDAILIETRGADGWDRDVAGMLRRRGFASGLAADGNTLFTRGAPA